MQNLAAQGPEAVQQVAVGGRADGQNVLARRDGISLNESFGKGCGHGCGHFPDPMKPTLSAGAAILDSGFLMFIISI